MADAENLTPEAATAAAVPSAPAPAEAVVAAEPAPKSVSPAPVKARKPAASSKPAAPAKTAAPAAVPVAASAPKPAARKVAPAKVASAKVAKAPKAAAPKPGAPKPVTPPVTPKVIATKPAIKRLPSSPKAAPVSRSLPPSKDQTMASKAFDFTSALKTAFTEIQEKAKATYEKSSVALTEVNEFAKGNVEAVVESGKILASGLQELGSTAVADSRAAFETLTAEAKALTTVSSPTAFFELQSSLMRKQFDAAVSHTSKNAEAMLKLMGDSFAPISNRVSIAVEKVSKVA